MRMSHDAVMTERTWLASQIRMMVESRTPTYSSVAWMTWPPGAHVALGACRCANFRRADVEEVHVLVRASSEQRAGRFGIDELDPVLFHDAFRRGLADAPALRGDRRRPSRGPALRFVPGQLPAHRAVLERDDRVRQAHAAKRFRADEAARAAAAVDDDRDVGIWREVGDTQHQLGARNAPRAGDAAARILFRRPRVDNDHPLATIDACLQLRTRDLGRAVLVQRLLAEHLARHVETLHHPSAARAPRDETAVEDAHVAIAHLRERLGRKRGDASVLVVDDDRRLQRGDEHRHARFEETSRDRRGAIDVAALVRGALANVEKGVTRAGLEQRGEVGGADHPGHGSAGRP
jgi:hypothetical protein